MMPRKKDIIIRQMKVYYDKVCRFWSITDNEIWITGFANPDLAKEYVKKNGWEVIP